MVGEKVSPFEPQVWVVDQPAVEVVGLDGEAERPFHQQHRVVDGEPARALEEPRPDKGLGQEIVADLSVDLDLVLGLELFGGGGFGGSIVVRDDLYLFLEAGLSVRRIDTL